MRQKVWNMVGWFYYRIFNRMKCGNNDNITNWQTIEPKSCYDIYSATEQPKLAPILAHTFWHGEILEKQLFCIKSFLCTQDMTLFELIIWLDGEEWYKKALENKKLNDLILKSNNKIHIKQWNIKEEIKNTPFWSIRWYFKWERILPFVADDFRIIALYKYGGLYFDFDFMFIKDMKPLLMRDEFVYAWENQPFANNALIFFRKGSYISKSVCNLMIRCKSSQPWILFKYRRKKLAPLMVYPCFMFDPLWTGYKEGMPLKNFEDFFKEFNSDFPKLETINSFKDFFPGVYAYHWHNQWNVTTFKNSYWGIFNEEFDKILSK